MTFASGRSVAEVIGAVILVGFVTGFVAVLCIGNYFRAKKAMERQRQRRLARLSNVGRSGEEEGSAANRSPAHSSSATSGGSSTENVASTERQHLLADRHPRRRNNNNETGDLLLFNIDEQQEQQPKQERELKIMRV